MRDRGKREVEAYNNGEYYAENNMPEFPCKKHPASASSSAGGICAYCLTDRLVQLVCPQCGEQRLSASCACSCSTEIFANPNTNNTSNIPDVGRISFLLENDQRGGAEISSSRPKHDHQLRSTNYSSNDEFHTHLRRSNSISAAATDVMSKGKNKSETGKLWKIGRLFRKKRDKSNSNNSNNLNKSGGNNNNNGNNNNEENYECNGVSRSRSLCSFRGFYDPEENSGFPGSISAARASSVSTGNFMLDSAKRSCFSESEARISNFDYYDASTFVGPNLNPNSNKNNTIFSLKETEFVSCDDPAFIDLKLNESNNNNNNNNYNYANYNYNTSGSNNNMMSTTDYNYSYNYNNNYSSRAPDLAAMRRSGLGLSTKEYGYRGSGHDLMAHEMFKNGGGSCRISDVSERDLRKCRKSYKVWKWFSKHPPHHTPSSSSKFDDHDFKS